ncbi:DUF3800 domain-containing protein [Azospirillum cavernae]|uniref:DUF3800 domain-containing protein n=1 Tax=Azospirillum cavernae TaxID=2320860 RepID=A0A418VXD2_9PROT|nr:DUF3800 domain-containing protein [Azospirillum cavernae]RJF81764.1 DUF3800 domain-containing protein [Azospirillum cavernae]
MSVDYVAYIDEAGDDGLKRVYPFYENGSSEWFIVSCLLVRAENDHLMLDTVKSIVSQFKNSQRMDIHYRDLIPAKKKIACEAIALAKIRSFVVMSNKKNMQNYYNEKIRGRPEYAEGDKNFLYWWTVRCLLERVTEECEIQSLKDKKSPQKLRIIFSRRGGMNYNHFRDYLIKLHGQSISGSLYNKFGDLRWSAIDHQEIFAYDHKSMAGLQLADVVASAFYQAVAETPTRECDPQFAKMLKKTVAFKVEMARDGDKYRRRFGYGVKLLPSLKKAELTAQQTRIFDIYSAPDWIKRR